MRLYWMGLAAGLSAALLLHVTGAAAGLFGVAHGRLRSLGVCLAVPSMLATLLLSGSVGPQSGRFEEARRNRAGHRSLLLSLLVASVVVGGPLGDDVLTGTAFTLVLSNTTLLAALARRRVGASAVYRVWPLTAGAYLLSALSVLITLWGSADELPPLLWCCYLGALVFNWSHAPVEHEYAAQSAPPPVDKTADLLALEEKLRSMELARRAQPSALPETRSILNYDILGEIGSGGFGRVLKGVDTQPPHGVWALKEIRLAAISPERRQQLRGFFEREQKMLSWLSHPAIVARREAFAHGDSLYLVMEFIEGETLAQRLARLGAFSEETAVSTGLQLCEALAYLHAQKPRPIVFRDLKPSNIMWQDGRVRLIDFGISSLSDDSRGVAEEAVAASIDWSDPASRTAETVDLGGRGDTTCLGTPGYAAPEQYPDSDCAVDLRADVFALGVVLHELLTTMRPPTDRTALLPVRRLNAGVSPGLEAILAKATHLNRDERYPSARAMSAALARLPAARQGGRR